MSGYGVGIFVFDYMATFIVNPENLKPLSRSYKYLDLFFEFDIAKRVPLMLYCLLASWLIILGLAIILIQKKKNDRSAAYAVNVEVEMPKSKRKDRSNSVVITGQDRQLTDMIGEEQKMEVEEDGPQEKGLRNT